MFAFVCLFVCLFFCLFVRSTTQKRMMSKCSNLVEGMTLRYLRNDVVLGLKGQGHRVNKCIFDACVNAHLTDNSNTAWVRTLWVPSISIVESADGGAGYSARCLCATTVVKLVDDRGWELCPSSRGRTLRYFFEFLIWATKLRNVRWMPISPTTNGGSVWDSGILPTRIFR